jgi:DNA-binding MarR family transcriptional regulator
MHEKPLSNWSVREVAQAIHESLLFFQHRNTFLGTAYQQPLSLHQSHILIEIAGSTSMTAKGLTDLGLGSQVLIARRLKELSSKKLISFHADPDDARARRIRLSPKGEALIASLDEKSNRLKNEFAVGFTGAELTTLAELLNLLCTKAGIPAGCHRSQEPALRPALRRMARFMGVLTPDFMESGLSSTEWQVLHAILHSGPRVTAGHLVELLHIEQSTMSRILRRGSSDDLIREDLCPRDGRSKYLAITSAGEKLLRSVDSVAVSKLSQALGALGAYERLQLASLLARYAFGDQNSLGRHTSCKSSHSHTEIAQLRRWLVNLLAADSEAPIPDQLVHPDNVTVSVWNDDKSRAPLALLEARRIDERFFELVTFVIDPSIQRNYFRRAQVALAALRTLDLSKRSLIVRPELAWPTTLVDPGIFGVHVLFKR